MIEVFVNDQPLQIPKGSTVMQACDAAGVDIPRCSTIPPDLFISKGRTKKVWKGITKSKLGCQIHKTC